MRVSIFLLFLLLPSIVLADDPCTRFSHLLGDVAEARRVSVPTQIKCRTVPEKQFHEIAKHLFAFSPTQKRLKDEELAYKLLGFIPVHYRYAECVEKTASQGLTAVYDNRDKTVYVREGVGPTNASLRREAVRALIDERYGLRTLQSLVPSTTDGALSVAALIEGEIDATLSRFPGEASSGDSLARDSCSPPESLLDQGYFSFFYGKQFYERRKKEGTLEDAFKSPPRSTTEVMYPAVLGRGVMTPPSGSPSLRDTVGEATLRILLKQFVSPAEAIQGAKGWDGDHLFVWGKEGRILFVVQFVSENDAGEYHELMRRVLARRTSSHLERLPMLCGSGGELGEFCLSRSGKSVTLSLSTGRFG